MAYYISKSFSLKVSGAFLLTSALGSLSANAFAQSLPTIDPATIAQDAERRINPETGEIEIVAGNFDPFEADPALAGSAALRRSAGATALNGQYVTGGAFLDISAIYATVSDDSYDVRGFERAQFQSGAPVNVIRYDRETLDCSTDTKVVTYDSSYYRGASYGLVGGLYRLFPRYRGHRDFGWHNGVWNRSHGYTYRPNTHNDRRPHSGGHRDYGTHSDRQRELARRLVNSRRELFNQNNDNGRNHGGRDRHDSRDGSASHNNNSNHNGSSHTRPRKQPVSERPAFQSAPKAAPPKPSHSGHSSRPQKTPKTKSPAFQSAPKASPSKSHHSSRPAINRATDKVFGRSNSSHSRHSKLKFYPDSYEQVSVSYRCMKEERLTLHIPQERLDAARFDGFAVMLIDNSGAQIPVFIPPNYVEGFRIAAGYTSPVSQGYAPAQPLNPAPVQTAPAPHAHSHEPIIYGKLD